MGPCCSCSGARAISRAPQLGPAAQCHRPCERTSLGKSDIIELPDQLGQRAPTPFWVKPVHVAVGSVRGTLERLKPYTLPASARLLPVLRSRRQGQVDSRVHRFSAPNDQSRRCRMCNTNCTRFTRFAFQCKTKTMTGGVLCAIAIVDRQLNYFRVP